MDGKRVAKLQLLVILVPHNKKDGPQTIRTRILQHKLWHIPLLQSQLQTATGWSYSLQLYSKGARQKLHTSAVVKGNETVKGDDLGPAHHRPSTLLCSGRIIKHILSTLILTVFRVFACMIYVGMCKVARVPSRIVPLRASHGVYDCESSAKTQTNFWTYVDAHLQRLGGNHSASHAQKGEPGKSRISCPRDHVNVNSEPVLLMYFPTYKIRKLVTELQR